MEKKPSKFRISISSFSQKCFPANSKCYFRRIPTKHKHKNVT